ncbi:hypothetical protein HNQ85_002725 [Anoxybacillus calidus]|jgi:hypothetical protein|uniref:Uncharacterized protein n=1 Tax=[Anoxybacillus] calidus TaxID=575178 RepID=A0A7V9Z1M1_9BACL|nr:hypothetical protein [Anoxybacillus calidus]MBA2872416.1 hypothetical protein [Anoxybacillus calidus]
MNLPKAIHCNLTDEDMDIKQDLANATDRQKRIKEIYRLGLQAEKNGIYKKETEVKRAKCFNLAVPSKPKLYVK